MRNSLIRKAESDPAGVGAGRVGGWPPVNGNDSHPPPTQSSVNVHKIPDLVGAPKNGGGAGEGCEKKSATVRGRRRKTDGPRGGADGALRVQRTLLASRYPRSAAAVGASAGVSRAQVHRSLRTIELDSGLPLLREQVIDERNGKPTWLWGIDWARLRGMG